MKRGVAILAVMFAVGCSDRPSPTTPTTPSLTRTGVLRGTVTDTDGLPVADATVDWGGVAEALGDRGPGSTDQNGQYRIEISSVPPNGLAWAQATKPGYVEQWKAVSINSRETTVNFAIARLPGTGR